MREASSLIRAKIVGVGTPLRSSSPAAFATLRHVPSTMRRTLSQRLPQPFVIMHSVPGIQNSCRDSSRTPGTLCMITKGLGGGLPPAEGLEGLEGLGGAARWGVAGA
ncbi:hypothetical protein Kisp02_35520 [Kineosporia sp. NBRC 101731]|nr:hypothetical protein Kisp02_35520 [Kineosporia sp. NBRC 101731]